MSDWVKCVNLSWTKEHLLSPVTKKTKCGLVWKKGGKGKVWVPNAAWFGAERKCKVCFPKRRKSRS